MIEINSNFLKKELKEYSELLYKLFPTDEDREYLARLEVDFIRGVATREQKDEYIKLTKELVKFENDMFKRIKEEIK